MNLLNEDGVVDAIHSESPIHSFPQANPRTRNRKIAPDLTVTDQEDGREIEVVKTLNQTKDDSL